MPLKFKEDNLPPSNADGDVTFVDSGPKYSIAPISLSKARVELPLEITEQLRKIVTDSGKYKEWNKLENWTAEQIIIFLLIENIDLRQRLDRFIGLSERSSEEEEASAKAL